MSKGGYSFIAYPESSCISKIEEVLSGMGAAFCWILHDKDIAKDGSPKKPHWHIVAGWEKSKPTWKVFKAACNSCGAVALSPSECDVQDFRGIEEYLTHKNTPTKYQYPDECVIHSDDWEPDLYETADHVRQRRRDAKKAKSAGDIAALIDCIGQNNLVEFADACDWVRVNMPDLFDTLVASGYVVKAYIDSRRNSGLVQSELALRVDALTQENQRLRDSYSKLALEARETGKERDFYKARLAAYEEQSGETPPPLWDF